MTYDDRADRYSQVLWSVTGRADGPDSDDVKELMDLVDAEIATAKAEVRPEDLNHIRKGRGVGAPALCGYPRVNNGPEKVAWCNECVGPVLDRLMRKAWPWSRKRYVRSTK